MGLPCLNFSLAPDQCGRPSSVRIAAVATLADETHCTTEGEGVGQDNAIASSGTPAGRPRPSSVISVLEATLPETGSHNGASGGSSEQPQRWRTDGGVGGLNLPTLRVVCVVELSSPEGAVGCALSPDGRRLAASLSSGRVATWVLPSFSPPPKERHRASRNRGGSSAATDKKNGTERQLGGESDGGASLDEGSTSLAGEDDSAALAVDVDTAMHVLTAAVPAQLTQPEFSIPHLPSPEELSYAKALSEYNKRVEAGEIEDPTSNPGAGEEGADGATPPPSPPQLSGYAHHLASVEFLPSAAARDGSGHGGGLSVWRANANVWRLYRLPPPPHDEDGGVVKANHAEEETHENRAAGDEDANQVGRQTSALLPARFDISSLPSAEWILPSPITALAVCEEEDKQGGGYEEGQDREHNDTGGPYLDWRCCGHDAQASRLAPLVAIGTENGGVYLCDAVLGTTREALSRHRARVTTLAFHRKG